MKLLKMCRNCEIYSLTREEHKERTIQVAKEGTYVLLSHSLPRNCFEPIEDPIAFNITKDTHQVSVVLFNSSEGLSCGLIDHNEANWEIVNQWLKDWENVIISTVS